ncbi:MAG: hypothetical protein LBV43_06040 [Prevotella sp.]|jgi:hypothetical protein|nr:hypothetical protein [Prevotella sp.]
MEHEDIDTELKNYIFEELTEQYSYQGENCTVGMIDFCNRNNLHSQKKMLITLMKPDRIK